MKKISHRAPSARRLRQRFLKRQYLSRYKVSRWNIPKDPAEQRRYFLFSMDQRATFRGLTKAEKSWYRRVLYIVIELRQSLEE